MSAARTWTRSSCRHDPGLPWKSFRVDAAQAWGRYGTILLEETKSKVRAEQRAGPGCSPPMRNRPPTPGRSAAPPSSFKSASSLGHPPFLQSRCIVGKTVVAIRPLRGLRGRSQNPQIHYAVKSFIYFRITYILSPGGSARSGGATTAHLFRKTKATAVGLTRRRRRTSEKVKIVRDIKENVR